MSQSTTVEAEIVSASSSTLVLAGEINGTFWKGEYQRVPETLGYLLVKDYTNYDKRFTNSALPHGSACVLPKLLGRAVLVRDVSVVNNPEIMAHEKGHVLAHRHGLHLSNYSDNEDLADKLASQLLRQK